MKETTATASRDLPVSEMAENLVGSEIIKLAGDVKALIAEGKNIYNFTIGDFNPGIFPIPDSLRAKIHDAYTQGQTNYPAANGVQPLRKAVSDYLDKRAGLQYPEDDILIAGGARPLIYAAYRAVVDQGDKILYPVPSWNNNHYTHLTFADHIEIETQPENNFMPSAEDLAPYVQEASLIALCSPLNPTGTIFSKEQLEDICRLVVAENNRRRADQKPLYLLYDQIYWQLVYGDNQHFDPVSLNPEIRPYTIYIDGISKAFAATGVRVGWAFGPSKVMAKMKSILGHVGAWSPKAEQEATALFLQDDQSVDQYLDWIKGALHERLQGFYEGMQRMRSNGHSVDAIPPQAALYLTVKFDLIGKTTPEGDVLNTTEAVTAYLLNEAHVAIVPFYAFGTSRESSWYRLSVGTASMEDVRSSLSMIEKALERLA